VSDALRPELPRELQVEVTGACNLACKMCLVRYRPKLGRREGAMCFHTFRALVDELPDLERVVLQGLGEPLLAPDLFQMIEYACARRIRIGFNTNATLLTRARSLRLVELGLDWLHISVDGATAGTYEGIRDGSDFERVRRNIADLTAVMRDLGAEKPDVSLVFVAMRRNVGELPALVALAAELGVPRLWVQNLSHSFNDTDPSGAYREIREYHAREALWAGRDAAVDRAFDEAREVAERDGIELRLPRLESPPPAPRAPGQPGCHWPFGSAYVTHDGKVQPCCMVMGADRAVLGRIGDDGGFAGVWEGAAYRDFRHGLLTDDPPEVCAGCSLYRRVF
jgi:radical SAM protein with 4Fe4S-binding SPASM domain